MFIIVAVFFISNYVFVFVCLLVTNICISYK